MRRYYKQILVAVFLCCFIFITKVGHTQGPPPPPPDLGTSTNKGPLGAPIGGGLAVYLVFSACLAGREWAKIKKLKRETNLDYS